jgi:hypothetical protein
VDGHGRPDTHLSPKSNERMDREPEKEDTGAKRDEKKGDGVSDVIHIQPTSVRFQSRYTSTTVDTFTASFSVRASSKMVVPN